MNTMVNIQIYETKSAKCLNGMTIKVVVKEG